MQNSRVLHSRRLNRAKQPVDFDPFLNIQIGSLPSSCAKARKSAFGSPILPCQSIEQQLKPLLLIGHRLGQLRARFGIFLDNPAKRRVHVSSA